MFMYAGSLLNPGIVIILPRYTTMKPAPLHTFISLIVIMLSFGYPNFLGSSLIEYCVLAIHIGKLLHPIFLILLILFIISSDIVTSLALNIFLQIIFILFSIDSSKSYNGFNSYLLLHISITLCAKLIEPFPPSEKAVEISNGIFKLARYCFTNSISSS